MSSSPKTSVPNEQTIESALSRLEAIVAEIEKSPPPLETLIERYEEGMKLLTTCREKLDTAEKRVEIITRTVGGKEGLEPFFDQ
ncbi:MAG: exodeoxyribonuclease VII small subunit [Verrucomicrobia bacterium]|nr:MAG: exodeoxyribonuclease VII small subunit [Verrucomicrobiota bacterium]